MFKIRTSDPAFFRNMLDSIASMVSEASFVANQNGMSLISMDSAGAAMVIFTMNSSAFDSYEVGETKITINMEMLLKILKRARMSDIMVMEVDEEENKLKILFQGDSIRSFSIPLIEPLDSEQKQHSFDFTASIKMNSKVFKESITDALMVSDSVVFELTQENFVMRADSESREFKMVMDKDTKDFVFEGRGKARYSLDYLEKMIKPSSHTDTVILKFSTDYPVQIEYRVGEKANIKFILAPRIEPD